MKGGGGSGDVTVKYVRDLCNAMEMKEQEGKTQVFSQLHDFYRENVAQQRKDGKKPGYTVEPEIPALLLDRAAAECDVAIISICRFSGENWDRKGEPNDGDFYLSTQEQKMVADVCAQFQNVVVVLNVGLIIINSVQLIRLYNNKPAVVEVESDTKNDTSKEKLGIWREYRNINLRISLLKFLYSKDTLRSHPTRSGHMAIIL